MTGFEDSTFKPRDGATRALFERIQANDYPTVEELQPNPVVAQLDELSAYYRSRIKFIRIM